MAKQQEQWKAELDNQVKLMVNDILEEKRLAEMLKAYHLSMSSISRYPHKNVKSKILAYSNFALVGCAQ